MASVTLPNGGIKNNAGEFDEKVRTTQEAINATSTSRALYADGQQFYDTSRGGWFECVGSPTTAWMFKSIVSDIQSFSEQYMTGYEKLDGYILQNDTIGGVGTYYHSSPIRGQVGMTVVDALSNSGLAAIYACDENGDGKSIVLISGSPTFEHINHTITDDNYTQILKYGGYIVVNLWAGGYVNYDNQQEITQISDVYESAAYTSIFSENVKPFVLKNTFELYVEGAEAYENIQLRFYANDAIAILNSSGGILAISYDLTSTEKSVYYKINENADSGVVAHIILNPTDIYPTVTANLDLPLRDNVKEINSSPAIRNYLFDLGRTIDNNDYELDNYPLSNTNFLFGSDWVLLNAHDALLNERKVNDIIISVHGSSDVALITEIELYAGKIINNEFIKENYYFINNPTRSRSGDYITFDISNNDVNLLEQQYLLMRIKNTMLTPYVSPVPNDVPMYTINVDVFNSRTEFTVAEDFSLKYVKLNYESDAKLVASNDATYSDNITPITIVRNVSKDGNGGYSSIKAAIDSLPTLSQSRNAVINIADGEYDIYEELGGDTYSASHTTDAGLMIPNWCVLIGANYGKVILNLDIPDVSAVASVTEYVSALNAKGNGYGKNLIVKGRNMRYALHVDTSALTNWEQNWKRCSFTHLGNTLPDWIYTNGAGMGASSGCISKFKQCDFTSFGGHDDFSVHDGSSYLRNVLYLFDNCNFKGSGNIRFATTNSSTHENLAIMTGCVGNYLGVGEEPAGSGNRWIITGYGNSFNMLRPSNSVGNLPLIAFTDEVKEIITAEVIAVGDPVYYQDVEAYKLINNSDTYKFAGIALTSGNIGDRINVKEKGFLSYSLLGISPPSSNAARIGVESGVVVETALEFFAVDIDNRNALGGAVIRL